MTRWTIALLALLTTLAVAQVSFGPAREISDFIYHPDHVLAHDMDGDGDLDVVAAEGGGAPLRVLWWANDGDGSFGNRREWSWGNLDSEVIAIADFNLDGRPDVWIEDKPFDTLDQDGMIQRRFLIALGDSAGSFQAPMPLVDESVLWTSSETIICDTNLDGRPDIVTPDTHYLATIDGTFAPGIPMPESAAYLWQNREDAIPADLDGDGDLDLLITSIMTQFAAQVMWNPGSGSFPDAVAYAPLDASASYRAIAPCADPSGGGGQALLVLTIEGSNESAQGSLTLFRLDAEGGAEQFHSINLPASDSETFRSWSGLSHDPVSGRSFIGVVLNPATLTDPTTELFEIVWSDGTLALLPVAVHEGVIDHPPVSVRPLDGDAFPDLLVPIPDITFTLNAAVDQIVWHAGTGSGGFQASPRNVCQPALGRMLFHAGDVDGDHASDLLVGGAPPLSLPSGAHELSLYRNNGDGSTFERVPIDVGRMRIGVVAVKDVTSPRPGGGSWPTGRMDVLAETYDYSDAASPGILRFEWLLQDDSGIFQRTTLTTEASGGLVSPQYGDWDGDETADLVYRVGDVYGAPVVLWRRGTNEGFENPRILLSQAEAVRGLVDLDWDGDLDLLMFGTLFGGEESYWCENGGSGEIVAVRRLNRKLELLAADLDGDGHEDFTENGMVTLARPGVTFDPLGATQPAPNPTGLDVDQDGDPDLVYTVPGTGTTGYNAIGWWENRGSGNFFGPDSSPPMLPVADAQWSIRNQQALADMDRDGTPDLVAVSNFAPKIEWFPITREAAPIAFVDWMASHGFTGHSAGPLFDLDGDLLSNWEEFAFGGQPGEPDPSHPGMPSIRRDGQALSLSFLRRFDAMTAGLSYLVMQSTDLSTWESWTGSFELSPAVDGYERINFPLDPEEPRAFFSVDPGGPPGGP